MKIVIIGCGYVGKAVAKFWKNEGHVLTASTRFPAKITEIQPYVHDVKVLTSFNIAEILQDQDVALLSMAPDPHSDYESTYLKTAESVVSHLPLSLKQILYTSSTSVYGEHEGREVNEDTPPRPNNPNGNILLQTEEILMQAASSRLHVCILRLGEIIGPGRTLHERLQRLAGKSMPGTGENMTNFSPLNDIVSGLNFAMTHSLNGIYNLCNDVHLRRRELYNRICEEEALPEIQWNPSQQNPHAGNKIVNSQKIKSLGFSFNPA